MLATLQLTLESKAGGMGKGQREGGESMETRQKKMLITWDSLTIYPEMDALPARSIAQEEAGRGEGSAPHSQIRFYSSRGISKG